MSTRSNIAVKTDEGVKVIYCHWDGYIEHNGVMLMEHYNTQELAEQVVSLGNLSFLAPSMECPEGHTFNTPVDGYSIAYGRDRGDSNTDPIIVNDNNYKPSNQIEFDYYWDGEKWYVRKLSFNSWGKWKELSKEVENIDD